MQHDTRTGDIPFFRKVEDFFLHRVLRKRNTSVDNGNKEKKEELNTFISTLVEAFFDPLADYLPASTVTSDSERAETKSIALDSLQNRLCEGIIVNLKAQ